MAFKMSPIGQNKDPYASMAKKGYIAPIKQSIEISDPEEGQSTVDNAAENNIIWNEPGDWKPANDGTGREMRVTTGQGDAEGYYVGKKKMSNEKWKEFLKTPKGKEWTASKNRSKTEYRDTSIPTSNEKDSEIPHKLRADEMTDNRIITGYKENPKYDIRYDAEYNKEQGNGPRKLPIYADVQAIKGLNSEEIKAKEESGDKNITVNTLTPDYDRLSESSTKDIQDDLKQNPDNNKSDLSDDYSLLEKEYNEKNSPTPQKMFGSETLYKENKSYNDAVKAYDDSTARNDSLMKNNFDEYLKSKTPTYPKMSDHFHAISKDDEKSPAKGTYANPGPDGTEEVDKSMEVVGKKMSATRQLMNKYMPTKSMVKQTDNSEWWNENSGESQNLNEFEITSHSNKEVEGLSSKNGPVDINSNTSAAYTNDDGEKVPLNRKITMTFQNRGHSIATQCAKSEGGSGCVKKMGSGWKVISNKTGKPWDANYDSEASANAALKAYHAG